MTPTLIEEIRIPKYKTVKVVLPHCNVCGEKLEEDMAPYIPFSCSCGEWEYIYRDGPNYGKYRIKRDE
jgi:hypothetical protein